jgi:pimeloyl-ACP methyl ester carboxylesterase
MRNPWTRRAAFRDVMRHGELVSPADAMAIARGALGCEVVEEVVRSLRRGIDVVPKDLDRIAVPVLLAWAERDRVLPLASCATRYRAEIPGVELRVLPGVGHVPMWDDTRLVTETIAAWAARHRVVATA